MPSEIFLAAVVDAAKADATLVSLTGHTDSMPKIGLDRPNIKGVVPFLAIVHDQTVPAIPNALQSFKRTTIEYKAYAGIQAQLTCARIADRIETLLGASGNADLTKWNVSTASLHNKQTRYRRTEGPLIDEDEDVAYFSVFAEFWWIDVPCTS